MSRPIWPLVVLLSLSVLGGSGCSKPAETSEGTSLTAQHTEVPGMSNYGLAQPIQVSNVTIVPVVSKEAQTPTGPEYATLAEAKRNAWIEIIEEPGDGEVDTLQVHNVGPKPILLLSGDLLLGGKQDRVVAKDTIVPPGKTAKIPVFCVEPGRWSGESKHFSYGDTSVPLSVKKEAAFGDQEKVWAGVGEFNAMAGAARGGRTTVQEGLNQKEVQAHIDRNLAAVRERLGKNVVGLMFLVDGEIKTLELFGNNRLFSASRDSLLKGALAQAAVAQNATPAKVDLAACAKFMGEAMASNRVVESRAADNVSTLRASPASRGRELHFEDAKREPGTSSSGLVHGTYTKQ